jgi:hypothetical protein
VHACTLTAGDSTRAHGSGSCKTVSAPQYRDGPTRLCCELITLIMRHTPPRQAGHARSAEPRDSRRRCLLQYTRQQRLFTRHQLSAACAQHGSLGCQSLDHTQIGSWLHALTIAGAQTWPAASRTPLKLVLRPCLSLMVQQMLVAMRRRWLQTCPRQACHRRRRLGWAQAPCADVPPATGVHYGAWIMMNRKT